MRTLSSHKRDNKYLGIYEYKFIGPQFVPLHEYRERVFIIIIKHQNVYITYK